MPIDLVLFFVARPGKDPNAAGITSWLQSECRQCQSLGRANADAVAICALQMHHASGIGYLATSESWKNNLLGAPEIRFSSCTRFVSVSPLRRSLGDWNNGGGRKGNERHGRSEREEGKRGEENPCSMRSDYLSARRRFFPLRKKGKRAINHLMPCRDRKPLSSSSPPLPPGFYASPFLPQKIPPLFHLVQYWSEGRGRGKRFARSAASRK